VLQLPAEILQISTCEEQSEQSLKYNHHVKNNDYFSIFYRYSINIGAKLSRFLIKIISRQLYSFTKMMKMLNWKRVIWLIVTTSLSLYVIHSIFFGKGSTQTSLRQLIFSKMAGMDQLREQVMDNHGKVYRSLMRIQDDLSIQGVLSEDLDQRITGLAAQIEAIRDNVASLDIKITEMAELNQDTNDRVKNIEDLILAIVQARPIKKPR